MFNRESKRLGLLVGCRALLVAPAFGQAHFRRGDSSVDGMVDLSDATHVLNWALKATGSAPSCLDAADANDDGVLNIFDGITTQIFFLGQGQLAPPGPETPGPDPTDSDGLPCAAYEPSPPPKLADFALGFECPSQVLGSGTKIFDIFATLTTSGNAAAFGAEGWAVSLGIEGGRIQAIDVIGVHVAALNNEIPLDLDLKLVGFKKRAASGHKDDPARSGAVSAILLSVDENRTLQPSGTERIARITVEVDVPATGEPAQVTLAYEDGFLASGRPVKNMVSMAGTSQAPSLGRCTIPLKLGDDCNNNGINDTQDIAADPSLDCTGNGVLDACELVDCNQNSVHDCRDLATGTSIDCNANSTPDECDLDCQPNGVADDCEGGETRYEFGFARCPPAVVLGEPGEVKTFEIYPTLTTTMATPGLCAQGWSFAPSIEGATIKSFTLNGVTARTIIDRITPSVADLGTIPAFPASHADIRRCVFDPSKQGIESAVALSFTRPLVLAPGTQRIAKVVIEATIPEGEAGNMVSVKFEGPCCSVCHFLSALTVGGTTVSPSSLGECKFLVREGVAGRQLPADGNQDGDVDISDGIHLLSFLFLGTVASLPCGDGTAGDPANLALLDSHGDGTIDLADAIRVFGFLFQGSAPPVLGTECVPIAGCPDNPAACGE